MLPAYFLSWAPPGSKWESGETFWRPLFSPTWQSRFCPIFGYSGRKHIKISILRFFFYKRVRRLHFCSLNWWPSPSHMPPVPQVGVPQRSKSSGIAWCSLFFLECKPTFIFLFRDFTGWDIGVEDCLLRAWALKVTDFLKAISDLEKPSKSHASGERPRLTKVALSSWLLRGNPRSGLSVALARFCSFCTLFM